MRTRQKNIRNKWNEDEASSLSYYPSIHLEGLRAPTKHLSLNILSSNRYLKVEPPNIRLRTIYWFMAFGADVIKYYRRHRKEMKGWMDEARMYQHTRDWWRPERQAGSRHGYRHRQTVSIYTHDWTTWGSINGVWTVRPSTINVTCHYCLIFRLLLALYGFLLFVLSHAVRLAYVCVWVHSNR